MTPKEEKKLIKLREQLVTLEQELLMSLTKKSSTVEISVSQYTRKISELKAQISRFK